MMETPSASVCSRSTLHMCVFVCSMVSQDMVILSCSYTLQVPALLLLVFGLLLCVVKAVYHLILHICSTQYLPQDGPTHTVGHACFMCEHLTAEGLLPLCAVQTNATYSWLASS